MQHFAVRTAQRPVKMLPGTGMNGKSVVVPAVWKSASTSLRTMMRKSLRNFTDPHKSSAKWCKGHSRLQQCNKHSSFVAHDAELNIAFVRNPLERFIASVYEHPKDGVFKLCDGKPCE